MNEELDDILETCLCELQHGVETESLLARYPKFAAELRPILKASALAKKMSAPMPSREVMMRGRAHLMQRVAETRERKSAPAKRVIPFFQRIAISLSITAAFLLGGTGLVGASSSALPGQNLYPVKRNWESLRLFFTFDQNMRLMLEDEFKHEREHEANELLFEGEEHEVEFYGVLNTINGVTYVSSLPVIFPVGAQIPPDGTPLEVKGRTTDQGYVEVIEFEIESPGENHDDDENESGLITPTPSWTSAENKESSSETTEREDESKDDSEDEEGETSSD